MKKDYIVELREEEADELMDDHWVGELVRCRDCKYWHETIYDTPKWMPCMSVQTSGNWFCADGEARE